ncbi:MAG: hypothetical protein EA376_08735 [Phycisphaeraceae bacterium]|nr:MAG: hypothetical protein EA376_08735 [Phycisphaeraceae bacterium]
MKIGAIAIMTVIAIGAPAATGQSLFQQGGAQVEGVDPAEPLYEVSLFAIRPPEPMSFAANDLITILVSESSSVSRDQKTTTDKEFDIDTMRVQWPELVKFLALGKGAPTPESLSLSHSSEFEGEGRYQRRDTIQNRVTARVLEVKPNGTLLLEARTIIQTDEEIQTYVLSGICRTEDVSRNNTVQSNQLFDLQLNIQHEGSIRNANKKGVFTRVLETLFNF